MGGRSTKAPRWMRIVLGLAGLYNLTWGALVILFPFWTFEAGGLKQPGQELQPPEVWQCLGMVVGVYGIGYLLAARDPFRHWPIVLVGLLGKVLGPLGAVNAALHDRLPWTTAWTNLLNDLVWWVPFGLILYRAYRASRDEQREPPPGGPAKALE